MVRIAIIAGGVLLVICIVLLLRACRLLRIKNVALDNYYRIEHEYLRASMQLEKDKQKLAEKLKTATPVRR